MGEFGLGEMGQHYKVFFHGVILGGKFKHANLEKNSKGVLHCICNHGNQEVIVFFKNHHI